MGHSPCGECVIFAGQLARTLTLDIDIAASRNCTAPMLINEPHLAPGWTSELCRPRYLGRSAAGIIACTVPFKRNPANPTTPEVQHDHRQAQRHHNQQPGQEVRFRLPDPPKREPDEMTSYDHLHARQRTLPGVALRQARHHAGGSRPLVVPSPEFNKARARRPDLLIAFGVSPADYRASNGYIVSEQGKPPDLCWKWRRRVRRRLTWAQSGITMPS